MLQAPVSDKKTKPEASRSEGERESERLMGLTGWGVRSALGAGQRQSNPVAVTQQAVGNQAALRMTRGEGGFLQRKCACGNGAGAAGTCTECQEKQGLTLQTKLRISEPGDVYEQEADRVADQVLAAPVDTAINATPPCIQRLAGQPTGEADMVVPASVDRALSSPGSVLEPSLQQDMQQRFGYDLSGVRVHTDETAEQSARELNANAYTVKHNIVFGKGQYAPRTHEGRRLIAHELTHTIQQNAARNLEKNTKREQISTVGDRLVQRDGEFNVPTLDDLYNNALRAARQTGNFRDAAEKLNGFNHEDIQRRLAQLTQDEVRYMHLGALGNPRVGPDSQVAQLTTPGVPPASTVPPTSTRLPRAPAAIPASTTASSAASAPISAETPTSAEEGLSTGAVIGIVVGVALVAGAIALLATPGGQALGLAIILSISEVGGGAAALATAEVGTTIVVEGIAAEGLLAGATATAGEGLLAGATATTAVAPATVIIQSTATAASVASSSSALATVTVSTATAAVTATTLSSDSSPPDQDDQSNCSGPTGLTPLDPIPLTWFKVSNYYPSLIEIQGVYFDWDDPNQHLPRGEPIGIAPIFRPHFGKLIQLDPVERGPGADRYRAVLTRYGFNWSGLQADHVQDLQWGGEDNFNNLWPMDASANLSAGPRQNDNQVVTFCETNRGPLRTMSLRQMKAAGRLGSNYFGRWFTIRNFQP